MSTHTVSLITEAGGIVLCIKTIQEFLKACMQWTALGKRVKAEITVVYHIKHVVSHQSIIHD